MAEQLRTSIAASGSVGLDIATLDERQRAVLDTLDGVVVDGGRVRPADIEDPFADHPFLAVAEQAASRRRRPTMSTDRSCESWSDAASSSSATGRVPLRTRSTTPPRSRPTLLVEHPEGFTVAQFRDATGASRKYTLPLVAELDARAVTRRRGDLRIGGPQLPDP